jgi:predicted RNase H-like nuclease (RuvC/YqgF family)
MRKGERKVQAPPVEGSIPKEKVREIVRKVVEERRMADRLTAEEIAEIVKFPWTELTPPIYREQIQRLTAHISTLKSENVSQAREHLHFINEFMAWGERYRDALEKIRDVANAWGSDSDHKMANIHIILRHALSGGGGDEG